MSFSLDKAFGVSPAALQLRAQRTQVLAENLANADTPNYKARDIDFKQAMLQAQGRLPTLQTTNGKHIAAPGTTAANPALLYRVPFSAALDGNTVETQAEQANFAENTVHYQATLTFLGQRINGLIGALKGE
jgi:flagellar basal-body rod protein FlgB